MEPIQPVDVAGLIDDAITAAHKWEGELGKGKKPRGKGKAEKALDAFKNGKLELGHPHTYVWRMKPEDFAAQQVPLAPEIQHTLEGEGGYVFYVVPVPVLLFPAPGSQYAVLHGQLELARLSGQRRPAIQSVFPEPYWKPVLAFGGSMTLALDGSLHWIVGAPVTSARLNKLPDLLKERVKLLSELASYIKVAPFEHTLGRMEIEAQHSDHSALWRLDSQQVIRAQKHTRFVLLLKVPKEMKQIHLRALAQADPDFDWFTAQVRHVWDYLPEALKRMLEGRRTPPLQDARFWEQPWTIDLPQ